MNSTSIRHRSAACVLLCTTGICEFLIGEVQFFFVKKKYINKIYIIPKTEITYNLKFLRYVNMIEIYPVTGSCETIWYILSLWFRHILPATKCWTKTKRSYLQLFILHNCLMIFVTFNNYKFSLLNYNMT